MNIEKQKIRIKNILKKDLIKVFSLSGVSTIVKLITGIIRTKVVAMLIGPSGIALVSQLNDTIQLFSKISNGGMTIGVTKYVAEFKDSETKCKSILSNSLKITLILSTLSGLILIIFSDYFSRIILTDKSYQSIFIVFGFSIILFAINRLLLAIINGFKEFTKFIKINIISKIVILVYSIILIYFLGIYGALLSAVTSQSIVLIITIFVIIKNPWFKKQNFMGKFNLDILKKLSGFTLLTAFTFFLGPIALITVRSFIIRNISIDAAGYWDGVRRVSGLVIMVITQALTIYLIPRFSELKSKLKIRKEIINTYKLVIPILILSFTIIYLFRDIIITILYTSEFRPMRELFLFEFIGEFFKTVSWVISIQMISKAMIKTLFVTEIFGNVFFILLSFILISNVGLKGVVYAFTINYIVYLAIMVVIFRKTLFLRYMYK
ncbi:MAG: O-antigen translocase [Candidatus Cloacimonetes bacterium]|nr:O-antigen translocase [Candidatus Cloacimonadota bacterium]